VAMGNVCHYDPCVACMPGQNKCAENVCCPGSELRPSDADFLSHEHVVLSGKMKPGRGELLKMPSQDLDRAEQLIHRCAFLLFDDKRSGSVPRTHELLRCYVLQHTALDQSNVDVELDKAASSSSSISSKGFVSLMARNVLRENEGPVQWARVSCSRWEIGAEECRDTLAAYMQEKLCRQGETAQDFEDILDVVMQDCGVTVANDEWEPLLVRSARLFRLVHQLQCV